MSVEAVTWALNLAPVPTDSGGRPNTACAFVLVGLANHAAPDGTGAFPSVKTLMRYTRASERTVRTALDRLEAEGLIRPCDPDIVAAKIKRPDRRPQGWDLAIDRIRDDLDPDDLAMLEHQFPGLAAHLTAVADNLSPQPVDNRPNGVQPLHPAASTGCNRRRNGVQRLQERGATAAPEPYKEPSREPPPTRSPARESPPAVDNRAGTPADGGGGDDAAAVFAALGDAWPLSGRQRARLAPAATAAVHAGWDTRELARHLGANTAGVRNPYAVLHTRLAELPDPPPTPPPRPHWCRACDQRTRLVELDDGRTARCPTCNPLAQGARL